jgi:hypothetical protein
VNDTPLLIDNASTIKLAKNPRFQDRSKHINVKYHLIQHHVEAETIQLIHCSTSEQIVDIFTKALRREKFKNMLGLANALQTKGGNVKYLIFGIMVYCKY